MLAASPQEEERRMARGARLPSNGRRCTLAVALGALALTSASGCLGASASRAPSRSERQGVVRGIVRCSDTVFASAFPVPGYRVALGMVSVPPRYLPELYPTGRRPWPRWRKTALFTRDDSPPVEISVPPRWRGRAAIAWGASRVASVLRVESCRGLAGGASGWSGGIYLRGGAACVPLTYRSRERSETILVGVGRRCQPATRA
jgi:hypothetical protein